MDWETAKKDVAKLVCQIGAVNVMKMVDAANASIRSTEEGVKLPKNYRFFEQDDWMGFDGSFRWPDGVRPILGELRVQLDDTGIPGFYDVLNLDGEYKMGDIVEALVVVSADDDGKSNGALVGIMIGSGPGLTATFVSRRLALASLHAFTLSEQAMPLSLLVELGYQG